MAGNKIKVKILDSIAGLADPRPKTELDAKYAAKVEKMNAGREKPFSKFFVDGVIGQMKARDRYGEKPVGFPRDWSFKPGDEPMIDADLAQKWEESGICMIVTSEKKAA